MQAVVLLTAAWMAGKEKSPGPLMCPAKAHGHAFERISILNVDTAGKEYDLAPDAGRKTGGLVEQTWKLTDYRDMAVVLRCHYRDSAEVISLPVPAQVKSCSFRYLAAKDGGVAGGAEMDCK